jgi:superfamily II DNA/RNA helicase
LADSGPATTVAHALVLVQEQRKRDLLEHVLTHDDCDSAIVFTRTKHRARRLAEQLNQAGHRAVGLQGNLSQSQRDRAMSGFRSRRYNILVATDIAARGIDVSGVSHVINFDVPNTPEAYTHRLGRTGRAELTGVACTFVTGIDHGWVRATERMIGSAIPRRQFEGFQSDAVETPQQPVRQEPSSRLDRERPRAGTASAHRTRRREFRRRP